MRESRLCQPAENLFNQFRPDFSYRLSFNLPPAIPEFKNFIAITPNLHLLHEIHDFASAYFGKSLQRRRKPTTELALSLNSFHCKLKWRQKWMRFFKLWKKIICKSLQKWWLTLRDLWFQQILVISRTMYRRLTDLRNSHTSSYKSVQNWINVFSIFAFLNRIILQIHK